MNLKLLPIRQSLLAIAMMMVLGMLASASAVGQSESETTPPQESQKRQLDPNRAKSKPRVAQNTGVDSFIGEFIDMDIQFNDEQNRRVKLGDYFDGKQPVMLSFNYSNCPKLCSVQLQNMTSTLRKVVTKADLRVGDDFQFISLSIDPNEQTSRARRTKELYTQQYNQKGTEDGWHFLTGDKPEIELLADICGFRYKYVPEQKLFSHPPVFILLSPKGKIVRYIHGLKYEPKTIELALIESAEGKIGSPINILSYGIGCFLYNEATGQYSFQAMALMRAGAALTMVLLIVTLVPYWFFRRGTVSDDKPVKQATILPNTN